MDIEHTCVMCGEGPLHLEEAEHLVEVDEIKLAVPFRTHVCTACGSKQALDDDLRFNARTMRCATKRHYGLLTGQEVREIRKRLGLSQERAASIFGGGPVAFSKYENDEVTQSEAMDRLLWLVGEHPWLVESLAGRLSVALAEETTIVIERSRNNFREEFIADAIGQIESTRESLEGFQVVSTASNDEIYRLRVGSRPVSRSWPRVA